MSSNRLESTTFILGIGAQKAGTSWLYEHLAASRQITLSPIKELHVFDVWYRPDICGKFDGLYLAQLRKHLGRLPENADVKNNIGLRCLLYRAQMIYDRNAYLEMFNAIKREKANYVCEITPSYSTIGVEGFKEIKALLEGAGMNLKIVFLMRDPIARYYSALRMSARETNGKFDVRANFPKLLSTPAEYDRGAYDTTITNLLSVFPRESIYFGFYERLFRPETVIDLEKFLGIESIPPKFDLIVNSSPLERALTPEEIDLAKKVFAPVYRFCSDFFGDLLPDEWRH